VLHQLLTSRSGLTIYSPLAQAANIFRGNRNVDTEAWAVLNSLPPEMTLQGVRNARDTILWRLKVSVFKLKMVLDERAAMQRARSELDRQLDEFERAAEEDAGGVRDWGAGGGVGEGEGEDENKEGEEERRRKSSTSSTSSHARVPPALISFCL
jgi:hypothetical protein